MDLMDPTGATSPIDDAAVRRGARLRAIGADGDRGDVLLGWLARVAVVLAIVGVVGVDTVTVLESKFSVADDANTAAAAARDNWAMTHSVQGAYRAAEQSIAQSNAADVIKPTDFSISEHGDVTLRVNRPFHTVVAHFLGKPVLKVATAQVTIAQPSS